MALTSDASQQNKNKPQREQKHVFNTLPQVGGTGGRHDSNRNRGNKTPSDLCERGIQT